VQGLRRFASPSAEASPTLVDVAGEIGAAVGITRHQVAPRARLVLDVAPGLPAIAAGRHELGQVVVNLLVNAAQAIPEGHAGDHEVRVLARAEGDRVVVEVSDTGIGIPEDVRARIFDPFFTTKQVGAGTGLGLAICHGIVTAAGGSISVRSEAGRGTTVRVELPAAGAPAAPEIPPPPRAARGGRRRVLVVDDEELVGHAIARVLSSEHDVEVMTSAAEAARRAAAGERWDVVLCDLIMPDTSGMELARLLERSAPDLADRLVFITGGAYTEASRAFLGDGARPYLEKPLDMDRLREMVRTREP